MLVLLGSKVTLLDNNEALLFFFLFWGIFCSVGVLGSFVRDSRLVKQRYFLSLLQGLDHCGPIGWVPDAEFEAVSGQVEDYCNDAVRVYSACICPWEA